MKDCSNPTCAQLNPQFSKDPRNKDGYQSQCKACRNAAVRARREANPEKFRAYEKTKSEQKKISNAEWRAKNRERYNAKMREYQQKHRTRIHYQTAYNLTLEDYAALRDAQSSKCAICNQEPTNARPLVVDHYHTTGKVRALLCYNCNRGLHYLDDPDFMLAALAYKAKHK